MATLEYSTRSNVKQYNTWYAEMGIQMTRFPQQEDGNIAHETTISCSQAISF